MNKPPRRNYNRAVESEDGTDGENIGKATQKPNDYASRLDEYFTHGSMFRSKSCQDNGDASKLDEYFTNNSIFRSKSCQDNDDERNNDVSTWANFYSMSDSVDDCRETSWLRLSEIGQKKVDQCTEEKDATEVNHRAIAHDKGLSKCSILRDKHRIQTIFRTPRTPRSSAVVEQIALEDSSYDKSGHLHSCSTSDTINDSYQLNDSGSTFSRQKQTLSGRDPPMVVLSQEQENSPKSSQGKLSTFHPQEMRNTDKNNTQKLTHRLSKQRKDKSKISLYTDNGRRLYSSEENISIRPGKLKYLDIQDSTTKRASTGNIPQSDLETKGLNTAYSYVKTIELPHQCQGRSSSNMISAIAPTDDGNFWLGFRESLAITLFNITGDVLAVADLGATVDDMTISKSGDLYISCPRAKCIKVIRAYDPEVVEVFVNLSDTPWWPRGLDIHPDEGAIVVCLALNFTAHSTVTHTNNCLMKFETRSRNHEGSLVTNEKCFGYPIKVSVSKDNTIVVSDFGFQCITMLNDQGLVIAKFSEISETQISRRIALRFDLNGDVVIVQGKQPTLTVLKLDGSPFSFEDNNVSELLKFSISAIAFDKCHRLLVGGASGVIKIFKHN